MRRGVRRMGYIGYRVCCFCFVGLEGVGFFFWRSRDEWYIYLGFVGFFVGWLVYGLFVEGVFEGSVSTGLE